MFDTVSKHLIENYSQDFATWLLGKPCILTRLKPTELSLEPIRADALIYTGGDQILHLEIQASPDPNIPFRLLDYRTRIYRKYPDKQVKQVVIYLKPTNSELVQQTSFEIPGTVHSFQVVRLWEQATELFLNTPGLLPLAVLSNTPNQEATLRQVAERIDRLENPQIQSAISDITAILAGLSLDKAVISRVLRRDIMQESVVYQEILEEGIEIGEQRGKKAGMTEAKAIIARNLLSIGIPIEQVAVATELTLEEIQQLRSYQEMPNATGLNRSWDTKLPSANPVGKAPSLNSMLKISWYQSPIAMVIKPAISTTPRVSARSSTPQD